MTKKLIALILCLVLAFSLAVPAFASVPDEVSPIIDGNGYTSVEFRYGGKTYVLYLTASFVSSQARITARSTYLPCGVDMYYPDARFLLSTSETVYITGKTTPVNVKLEDGSDSRTIYTEYTGGAGKVVGCSYISGSATFHAGTGHTLYVTMN